MSEREHGAGSGAAGEVQARRTRRRRVLAAGAAAAIAVVGVGTTAVARSSNHATHEVMAMLDFKHLDGRFRLCEGTDGTYDEENGVARGMVSGDPRLSGPFELRFDTLDRLTDEGHLGRFSGTFVVVDEATGRRKVDAKVELVQHYGLQVGTMVGQVWPTVAERGSAASGPATLAANVKIGFIETDAGWDIVGQIGGSFPSEAMPAIIQMGGRCTGSFEAYSIPLP